jgi:hypothetical protein
LRITLGKSGFWSGKIVDRQINAPTGEASKYWVENFLDADFITTGQLGTKRFASALSDAARSSNLEVRQEINSIFPFLKQFDEKGKSVDEILTHLGVSDEAVEKVRKHMPPSTSQQVFTFDFGILRNSVTFRTMTLDTGVSVTADSVEFRDVVSVDEDNGSVTLSTTGKLIGDQLRKSK